MIQILKYTFLSISILNILFITGCFQNNKQIPTQDTSEISPLWKPTEKSVCIVFGPGYSAHKELVADSLELLSSQFGLKTEGGLIKPLFYPDDFIYFGTARISRISDLAHDSNTTAIITIGCPEGTATGLSSLRAQKKDIRVISAFPQDDIIAIEGTSSFVLDFNIKNEILIQEEQTLPYVEKIPEILKKLVTLSITENLPHKGENLRECISEMIGNTWILDFYKDPETGIRSGNHFLLSEK